ncbi:hypothetical protein RCZ04_13960 [Capnocytophaga sp. HP1101]
MNEKEKIQELISNYISFLQEEPSNPNEVYKWQAIKHFEQHWDINAPDFYEMFKEAFRKRDNLVDYRPFGILEALGENYPTKLKELFEIVYGVGDFYSKLGSCRTFIENIIDDLKEKSNTNFSTKIDERTLSFLLTMKFPNEHTFYKKDIYTKLCEYLGEVPRKEHRYAHYIELLTEITPYLNNPTLQQLTSNFIPQGLDEPLLLAQDIVYQNMTSSSERVFRNVLDKIPKHWASVFFYKLGNIIEDLTLEDTDNQVFSVRLDEKSLRYHIGKRICLSVSAKEFLFITGREVDIPKLRREEFERPNNAFLYYQGTLQHIETYYSDIKNAIKEEIALDKGTYPKSYDNSYFRAYVFEKKYKKEFEKIESNMTNQTIEPTIIDLLHYKPQIILQGPPGTGKTREAKRIAKQLLGLGEDASLEGNEQFKLIQFHPSYSYEDFVRGIVAKPNETGEGIVYTAENKVLAEFAEKALENYNKAQQSNQTLKEQDVFNAFIDHIKEELAQSEDYKYPLTDSVYLFDADDKRFKYKGDNWEVHSRGLNMNYAEIKRIIESGVKDRQSVTKLTSIGGQARQHASYFLRIVEKFYEFKKTYTPITTEKISLKNYILIIDEINRANLSSVLGELIYALEYRGEAVESMYAVEEDNQLILPPNLYIIGTMNTADRSVGHIDYAIRRRFAFVNVLPKDLTNELGDQFESELFAKVTNLFNTNLSPEFKKEDVQLGHSYFITDKTPINIRWEYEIKPILLEYVKDGILVGQDIESTINSLITV